MITTATQNDVLRYVYEETSPEENIVIENSILVDDNLSNVYHEMCLSKNLLDNSGHEPKESTISAILSFSKLYTMQSA